MFLTTWDPCGPYWTISNDSNDFLLKSTSAKSYFVLMGQQIDFCLKWSKSVQIGPKRSKIFRNISVFHFGPFWTPLDHFGMLTSLPCLAIFVCFIGAFILGHPVVHLFLTFVLPMFFLFLEQLSIILVAQEFRSIMKQVWDQGRWY